MFLKDNGENPVPVDSHAIIYPHIPEYDQPGETLPESHATSYRKKGITALTPYYIGL